MAPGARFWLGGEGGATWDASAFGSMTARSIRPAADLRFREMALAILLAALAYKCVDLTVSLTHLQPLGVDFSCLWAGGRAALDAPSRIYDFAYVTELQGWPLGAELRPYVYPPSVLLLFAPLATLPLQAAYALWTTASGVLYLAAARRAGAPWVLALMPVVWLVAICGQVTFAVGGLVLLAMTMTDSRPFAAGALIGLAAALKPQMLVLMPIGLIAAGQWRTMVTAGVTVGMLFLASLAFWGPHIWLAWISAISAFQREVLPSIPGLRGDEITVYAWLDLLGQPPELAYLLAPAAAWMVWSVFRSSDAPLSRSSAAFGGALLTTPYAMHYDAALLAPGVAALLVRTRDRTWLLHATVATVFTVGLLHGPTAVLSGLAAPLIATWSSGAEGDRRRFRKSSQADPA